MSLPTTGRLLAIDLGERRHGVARSDPNQQIAQPLCTLSQRSGKRFPYKELERHLADAVGIVVGLPLTAEGREGARAQEARTIAELIARRSGLAVDTWDERFTTARALAAVKEMGGSTRGRKGDVDQLAATVILQTYLDAHRKKHP